MNYTLGEIATIVGGELIGSDNTTHHIVTDSRYPAATAGALFVALRGVRHYGHRYIQQMYDVGVRAFLVERGVTLTGCAEASFITCDDTLQALQSLAAHHRNTFKGTVVAITGSNGKTTTKEWIAQLAPETTKLFRSPKSYNSQVGVALSLLMIEGDEQVAVIEAGVSQRGEMERLERMIRPEIGIFTYLGEAHQEGFTSSKEKLREKLLLFNGAKTLLINADGVDMSVVSSELPSVQVLPIAPQSDILEQLPYSDTSARKNASAALALYRLLGVDEASLLPALRTLSTIAMRLELKEGINNSKLVNDSYNNDIHSLSIALEYLNSVAGSAPKMLILSDILQSGLPVERLYERVGELITTHAIARTVAIGAEVAPFLHLFSGEVVHFTTTEEFLSSFPRNSINGCAVLIKGSRPFGFERISRALELKTHTTTLEVNLDAMAHNLNYYRSLLSEGTRVMAMVKANGYGSGNYEVAAMLQYQGVAYLAVAFADEGVVLRRSGISMPIVVLNADAGSFDLMIEHRLEPEIYSLTSLEEFSSALRRYGESNYPIHLKLDTGMHRLGFQQGEIPSLIDTLRSCTNLHVATLFSHLAASDETQHDRFTQEQIDRFGQMSRTLKEAFPTERILCHICNSAGIERFAEAHLDMVRLGIGLYGVGLVHPEKLCPVSSLKSRIVQIKELAVGESVGYGRHAEVREPIRIATIPIGYADGLNRHLGRGAWSVVIRGVKAPIIGNICMDTCMLDITHIAEAQEGDAVTIFGEGATVAEMASVLDTIPYEVFTSISSRVKRIYIKE